MSVGRMEGAAILDAMVRNGFRDWSNNEIYRNEINY